MLKGGAIFQILIGGFCCVVAVVHFSDGHERLIAALLAFGAILFVATGWEDLLMSRTRRKLEMRATYWNLYMLNKIHGNPPTESMALEADLLDEFHRLYGKDEKI